MNVTTTDATPVAAPIRLVADSVTSESLSSQLLHRWPHRRGRPPCPEALAVPFFRARLGLIASTVRDSFDPRRHCALSKVRMTPAGSEATAKKPDIVLGWQSRRSSFPLPCRWLDHELGCIEATCSQTPNMPGAGIYTSPIRSSAM